MDDEEDSDPELARPLVRAPVLFDATSEQRAAEGHEGGRFTDMPRAAQAIHDREAQDVWAELG